MKTIKGEREREREKREREREDMTHDEFSSE